MRIRATAATVAVLACTLTACSSTTDQTGVKTNASSTSKSSALTAKQAAVELADATGVTNLGNPTDNTSGCSNATGKEARYNCRQLITTDTVSIYEFESSAVAAHWVGSMKKVGNDWRQVDRFALAWSARNQSFTSDNRRAELVAALKKATADKA